MKKILPIISLLIILLSSCGNNRDPISYISKEVVFYSMEVKNTCVMNSDETWTIFGNKIWDRIGAREIYLPVKINVKGAIYCSEISDFEINNKTIEFTLPDAKLEIENVKIDWKNSDSKIGLLRQEFTSDELKKLAEEAARICMDDVRKNNTQYQNMSKANAQKTLTKIINNLGYTAKIHY